MTNITIFGDGNMGTAIAGAWVPRRIRGPHHHLRHGKEGHHREIVILAVPYPSLQDITGRYATSWRARSSSTSPTR